MSQVVRAVYEKGVFRPIDPLPLLAEGTSVVVTIQNRANQEAGQAESPLSSKELRELIRSKNPHPEEEVPEHLWEELHESIMIAHSNVRDPEVMRQAAEDMDRLREEIYKREGLLDIVMPLLRETREGE